MQFKCKVCNKNHNEIPAYHADRPVQFWDVPEDKRTSDVFLTSDSCVIADKFFFIHGLIEIPILKTDKNFVWGVWISLKEENFFIWQDHYEVKKRDHIGPFFGWLSTQLALYPDTINLKTISLTGPSLPGWDVPGNHIINLRKGDCQGCEAFDPRIDPVKKCMLNIEVKDVLKAIENLM